HARDGGAFLHIELLGTREAFEVPIAGALPQGATFRAEGRVLDARHSQMDLVVGAGKVERRIGIVIEPSQYEADADRPDRVKVTSGGAVLEKDVFPTGSKYQLSATGADASTVVALPGSGKSKSASANVVVELAPPGANAAGIAVTLNLQKSGEKKTIALASPDLTGGSARLVKHAPAAPDARGNPTHAVKFDVL